jgi:hypothetical protein
MAVGFGIAALLATTVASATGGVGGKGETGDKGGLGPANSTTSGAAGTAETPRETDTSATAFGGPSTQNPDVAGGKKVEEKPWEVGLTFETHRLLEQTAYSQSDYGPTKMFNVLYAVGKYAFTDYDTVLISGGALQYFIADSGESGFRATDISLGYTRMFPLPEKIKLRASVGATIPVSYYSQLATNITTPSLSLSVSRKFGDLALEARISGRYFWDRYTSQNNIGAANTGDNSGAGAPNIEWAGGGALSAEYDMPFYRPLSAGIALTDSYQKFYNVGQPPAGTTFHGATSNPTTDNNPWQQSYGGEIFVRYVMPDLAGVKSDLTVALANGDPSLGYPSVLHDGVVHPYFFYYYTTEVYAALSGRY